MVRGKLRVGFIATRDIQQGEELLYDYGVRGESWMMAQNPQVSPKKDKPSTTFEQYRRRRFCPVPGCPVKKPLKKLPNHLKTMHSALTPHEAKTYLQKAKYATPGAGPLQAPAQTQRILSTFFSSEECTAGGKGKGVKGKGKTLKKKEARQGDDLGGEKGEAPQHQMQQGPSPSPGPSPIADSRTSGMEDEPPQPGPSRGRCNTRSYPSFTVDSSPFLTALLLYAQDRFGLGINAAQAKKLVADVSKYLHFAGKGIECCSDLYDTHKIRDYLMKLDSDGILSSGQLTKLSRIEIALGFAGSAGKWIGCESEAAVTDAKSLISRWKRLQRERTARQKAKLPALSTEIESWGDYTSLFSNPELQSRIIEAMKGPPSDDDFDALRDYIAFLLQMCTAHISCTEHDNC